MNPGAGWGSAVWGWSRRAGVVAAVAALAAAAAAVLVVSLASGPAEAAFPGKNGRIAFNQPDGTENVDNEIYTSNPDGSKRIQITDNDDAEDFDPAFSPNGRSIVYIADPGEDPQIRRVDLDRQGRPEGSPKTLLDGFDVRNPAWSPNGKRIVFSGRSPKSSTYDIFTIDASDGSDLQFVVDSDGDDFLPSYSPDGRYIAFSNYPGRQTFSFVYIYDTDTDTFTGITGVAEQAYGPDFSPDGERVAYAGCDLDGEVPSYQIFTQSAFEEEPRRQVTDQDGSDNVLPAYSPEGDQILYRHVERPGGNPAGGCNPDNGPAAVEPQGGGTTFAVGRVPSNGGTERTVASTTYPENFRIDEYRDSGPNWGPRPKKRGGGNDGGNDGGGRPECTIRGSAASEAINGTDRRDVICAGPGDDSVNALRGNDVVFGGPGDDSLNGNRGDDDLFGEEGNDALDGGGGKDKLVGGPGRDETVQ